MKSLFALSVITLMGAWPFEGRAVPAPEATNQVPTVVVSPATAPPARPETVAPSLAPSSPASNGQELTAQVAKMAQNGADAATIKAFVQSWSKTYTISADEILHLHDVGLPSDVLMGLISHEAELQATEDVQNEQRDMTNPPPAVLYPYPGTAASDQTNSPVVIPYPYPYPVPVPSEAYPGDSLYLYGYPSAALPGGLYSPYYFRSPLYVPHYGYGYGFSHYGYRYSPYHSYGYGYRGYRGYGYPGHYGGRSYGGWRGGGGYGWHGRR